jgi:hypothetical protein
LSTVLAAPPGLKIPFCRRGKIQSCPSSSLHSHFVRIRGDENMKQNWQSCMIIGVIAFGSAVSPAVAQQQPKQQPTQQQRPAQQPVQQRSAQQPQTYVPARPSAVGQLNAAAQGPAKAAPTFDGGRGTPSTPVHVQTSTTTANAATIAAQQNAAELARRSTRTNPATRLDNHPLPAPGSH